MTAIIDYTKPHRELDHIMKDWGIEVVLIDHPKLVIKELFMNDQTTTSMHKHPTKTEVLFAWKGVFEITFYDESEKGVHSITETVLIRQGTFSKIIEPNTIHKLVAFNGDATIIEFSTQPKHDSVRWDGQKWT